MQEITTKDQRVDRSNSLKSQEWQSNEQKKAYDRPDPPCGDNYSASLCQLDVDDLIAHITQPDAILYIGP